jgi:hypothetical protein
LDYQQIIYFRLAERAVMTIVVILIAVTVTVAFWRSVQKMDFSGLKTAPDLKVSLLLNTPVFVMLALMGYAYVVLNAKISLDQENGFVGMSPGEARPRSAPPDSGQEANGIDNSALERNERLIALEGLNCLAANDEPLPEDLQDALVEAKLLLLLPVWSPDWQPFEAFAARMRLAEFGDADPDTLAMFNRRSYECPGSSSP